ncbi:MAG TPA: VOC family protein [Acidimicrobiales bacterium]|nr:VOC family protein [Acidimicrobiales bacterium]
MPLMLSKPALDIGIVVHDEAAMVAFYGDTLGLVALGKFPVPGAVQHRFEMGQTTMKLVVPDDRPTARPPGRSIKDATGIRYWTAFCTGLDGIVAECQAAGSEVVIPVSTGSTGVRYAVLTDPDGNCFELIEP